MERPELTELKALLAAVDDLRAAEEKVVDAKARLVDRVNDLGNVADRALRLNAAIYAYWVAPEVNANQLALVTIGRNHPTAMLKNSDGVSIGIACDRCHQDMEITSRTQLRETMRCANEQCTLMPEGYRVICGPCREAVYEARYAAHLERAELDDTQRRNLERLSYRNYLLTPEWAERRAQAISEALSVHGELTCQICTAQEPLSFTHLSLDLVGHVERVELLCATCWGALDAAGKLAHTPVEENRAYRFELDQMTAVHNRMRGRD